jgi:hypothetical protein
LFISIIVEIPGSNLGIELIFFSAMGDGRWARRAPYCELMR